MLHACKRKNAPQKSFPGSLPKCNFLFFISAKICFFLRFRVCRIPCDEWLGDSWLGYGRPQSQPMCARAHWLAWRTLASFPISHWLTSLEKPWQEVHWPGGDGPWHAHENPAKGSLSKTPPAAPPGPPAKSSPSGPPYLFFDLFP